MEVQGASHGAPSARWITALALLCAPAWADEVGSVNRSPAGIAVAPAPATGDTGRLLAGHAYFRSALLNSPFVTPSVQLQVEGASATTRVSGAEADLKSSGVSPSLTLQADLWGAGLELYAGLAAIAGSDSYSALVQGANLMTSFSATVKVPALRRGRWILSPFFTAARINQSSFSPLNAAAQAILTKAASASFLATSTTTQLQPGLATAWTLGPSLGVTAELSRVFAATTQGTTSQDDGVWRAGLGVSALLQGLVGVPVGMTLSARNDWNVRAGASSSPILGVGLVEASRRNFNFGLEATRLMAETPSLSFIVSMAYYY